MTTVVVGTHGRLPAETEPMLWNERIPQVRIHLSRGSLPQTPGLAQEKRLGHRGRRPRHVGPSEERIRENRFWHLHSCGRRQSIKPGWVASTSWRRLPNTQRAIPRDLIRQRHGLN